MRNLTEVEKNIVKAIHAETGTKALIELLIEWATIENGTPAARAQVETVAAEVAESDRVAKLDAQARGVKAQANGATGLTEGESRMLIEIAESEFNDGDPTQGTWSNVVCKNKSDAALVGSLNKKGMVNSTGSGRDATIDLTIRGLAIYRQLRPESQYAKDHAQVEIEQAQAEAAHVNL